MFLLDSGKVEMVGYDGPGDKKFRLKSLGSQAGRPFPPNFSADPTQPPAEYGEEVSFAPLSIKKSSLFPTNSLLYPFI